MSFRPIPVRLPRRAKNTEAMALIVVLFILALVTITILAFFSQAMLNRNISFSSAGQARANLVALSGLNYVKNDLLEEIQEGSTQQLDGSGAGIPIFEPTSNTNMAPYRMTANVSSTNIPPNLVKWSSGTFAQWPATGYTQAGPTRAASGNSTLNGSSVGRYIATSRWTKPDFGSTTATNVVPDWVLITRQGPLTNTVTSISTLADSSPSNPNYVVGRYAYIVYDEGGALDVAAAGYSPTIFPSSSPTGSTYVGRKGSPGFADLTQLGLTSAQADLLVNWRNATTSGSMTSYINYLTTNAPASGFLQAAAGDHAFLSRQDLIQYWTTELNADTNLLQYVTTFSREKNAPSWGPEHDANDPNSSIYWNGSNADASFDPVTYNDTPALSYQYHSNRDTTTSYNRFLPNVRVKTAFQRLNGEQAVVGEPLIKYRFDLNKLSWLSYTGIPPVGLDPQAYGDIPGGSGAPYTVYYQAIYDNFGLIPNFASDGVTFLSWTYNHTLKTMPGQSNGTLAADTTQIMTLDQVASLPASLAREPDFFELLQAVILQGSLGLCSGDPTQATVNSDTGTGGEFYRAATSFANATNAIDVGGIVYRPMNKDSSTVLHVVNAQSMYQIIQIGANIIDQYDTDNFPTEIVLNGDHFYGVENLPYVSGIGDAALRVAAQTVPLVVSTIAQTYDITSTTDTAISANNANQAYVHRWLDFALWNPHQNAANPPTAGPLSIRIAAVAGEEYPYVLGLGTVPSLADGLNVSGRNFEVPGTAVTAPSTTTSTYADGPAWVAMKLASYTNFPEPMAINYTNSYTSDANNPSAQNVNDPDGRVQTSKGWQRAGIYLGWSKSPDNPYKVPACEPLFGSYNLASSGTTPVIQSRPADLNSTPITFYLQYEDVNHLGTWHTYEELHNVVYNRGTVGFDTFMEPNDSSWSKWTTVPQPPNNTVIGGGASNSHTVSQLIYGNGVPTSFNGSLLSNMDTTAIITLDPRSLRLNFFEMHNGTSWGLSGGTGTDSMPTSTIIAIGEPSKGISAGPHFQNPSTPSDPNWTSFAQTWVDNVSVSPMKNYDTPSTTTTYYRDRDFIPRVGDAAGWTNVVFPPDATGASKGASPLPTGAQMQRPLHLDRPFRSVAELGYVFRDDPWKTLNLISANSADAGLLDAFCIGSGRTYILNNPSNPPAPAFVAGKMNINSAVLNVIASGITPRTSPVLQAFMSQTLRDYQSSSNNSTNMDTAITSASDITNLSTNVVNYVRLNGPLSNIGDLSAVFPQTTSAAVPTPIYTGLKNPSEAFVRALADSSGTRTWNLMIDIIAQSGRYSSQAGNLNNFTIEGEKHYWLHVAIDRFTGEIVDQQLEPVTE